MNDAAALSLYDRVSAGLGRRPGHESIADAARRALARSRGRRRRAALVILFNGCGDPWRDLERADRVLRGVVTS